MNSREDGQRVFSALRNANATTAPDKTAIEYEIAVADKQIDRLVHELYGLTGPPETFPSRHDYQEDCP